MADTPVLSHESPKNKSSRLKNILQLCLVIVILGGGGYSAKTLMESAPKAQRAKPLKKATLIETVALSPTDNTVRISSLGKVMAARNSAIFPKVNGEITAISDSFIPGGFLKKGEELVSIEEDDYRLAVLESESALEEAKANLMLEIGEQQIARREYELLGKKLENADETLILRKPQLETAKARVKNAEIALERAKLDLARTRVTVPFDGIVNFKGADLGSRVTTATKLAEIIEAKTYWIQVSVPRDRLTWIDIPVSDQENGSEVLIFTDSAGTEPKIGEVLRLLPTFDERGQMAQLLISINDPMARSKENRGKPAILLESILKVEIMGKTLKDTIALPRTLLRINDTVWTMDDQNTLVITTPQILYRGETHIIIGQGLPDTRSIVKTNLNTPVEGMPLRIRSDSESKSVSTEERS